MLNIICHVLITVRAGSILIIIEATKNAPQQKLLPIAQLSSCKTCIWFRNLSKYQLILIYYLSMKFYQSEKKETQEVLQVTPGLYFKTLFEYCYNGGTSASGSYLQSS